uniref:Putative secreted protein n=1 Tax=Anopheles triannulatus TaxID=58253 RepID=A0A2M4B7W5_9DIPT
MIHMCAGGLGTSSLGRLLLVVLSIGRSNYESISDLDLRILITARMDRWFAAGSNQDRINNQSEEREWFTRIIDAKMQFVFLVVYWRIGIVS